MDQRSLIIMESNYNLFCDQLSETILEYPNLEIIRNGNSQYLKGILDIPNDHGAICQSFLMEIHFTPLFPFRFPILFETGADIPNEADWHKYPNGSCCITVEADEIIKCKHGITVKEFIRNHCIAFFANYLYKLVEGNYMNGEYKHGIDGIKQFYQELFHSSNIDTWISCIEHVYVKTIYPVHRNEICFCGSTLKFKFCHKKIFDKMLIIGHERILHDLKLIR